MNHRAIRTAIIAATVALGTMGVAHAQQPQVQFLPPGSLPPPPGSGGGQDGGGSPGFGNQQPNPGPDQQPGRQNFADELTDFGVPPQSQLQQNVGSPTPTTIPGGHVITTKEMVQAGQMGIVIVDVLANPHASIPGAQLMPGAGNPGTFNDATQTQLWNALKSASGNDPKKPIAFLCAGPRCWESYNAALRAERMGFKMVLWYRGGLAAWQAAGLPVGNGGGGGMAPSQNGGPGFDNGG